MRMRKFPVLFLFILLLSSFIAAAQAKLERIDAAVLASAQVPATVRAALDPGGVRLVRADSTVLCEIWWRKVPLPAAIATAKGVAYPQLSPGMFIGLISFPNGGKDFRGQPVKGYFTMRYALLPEDGNHLGVAPTRDFVLLSPATEDSDPSALLDFSRLVKLSAQAAGTNHPAAFLLLAPEPGDVPRTYQNADGYQVFVGALKTDGGKSVPITLVVKGQAEQ
jgi:hypothetical protein